MVGSAIVRRLKELPCEIVLVARRDLDLRRQAAVEDFFQDQRPNVVFLAAATVGGIGANSDHPATFIRDNLLIQTNVIDAARQSGAERLLFLGSSCIYPKYARQPITEDQLLTGPLEPTNEAYAVAKIAGIKMIEAYRKQHGCGFIAVQPTNLYGPGDNYDPGSGHVIGALVHRFHTAKVSDRDHVTVWGTGTPRRDFLHVDDLAEACLLLTERYDGPGIVNVGSGSDITIRELASKIAETVGYSGRIDFDPARPDGTPRKLLDTSLAASIGWAPRTKLNMGLRSYYEAYLGSLNQRFPGRMQ